MTALIYGQVVGFGTVYEDSHQLAAFPTWTMRPNRVLSGVVWWLVRPVWALHLLSVSLHLLNGWLVWRLCTRVGLSSIVVGMFLLHPIQIQAVAYLSGLPDLLMTACVLMTALCALERTLLWTLVSACLACVCKESGVVAFGIWGLCWPHPVSVIVLGGIGWLAWPAIGALWTNTPISVWQWVSGQAWAVWNHLYTVLPPFGLRVFMPPATAMEGLLSVIGLVIVGCVTWALRPSLVRFALLWVLISLSVRFVVPTYGAWLSPHQVYEPFVGVWLLIGAVMKGRDGFRGIPEISRA